MSTIDDKIQDNKLQIIGKLTASLIHEIRNPLSAIKLNLDYLSMIEQELPKEVNESVDVCKDALSRIQYLIDNMFTFTKRNVKGDQKCSINEITKNAVGMMRANAERRSVTLELCLDEKLPLGYFDRSKLLQVFLNLITNAIESCEEHGEIKIKTYFEIPDYIVWEIEDNGVGICEDDKERIFQDFYTSKEKGTGLGLSVCKMLLKEYQADLGFESEIGKGTKFFIKFNSNLMDVNDEIQNINN